MATAQHSLPAYTRAGSGMLAMQSTEEFDSNDKQDELIDPAAWPVLRGYLEQHTQAMRTWRNSWWMENWSDLALFILPRRSIWLTQSAGGWPTANNMLRGCEINQVIVDPTGTYAVRVCAGGMVSGLASPSRPWFKMISGDKHHELDAASRVWMDETEDKIYTVLFQSNFYNAFAQECEDTIVYGTAPSICYDDADEVVRFYNPSVGEYYLACNGTMRDDTLYRVFVMTVRQIVSFFGVDNVTPEVRSLWSQGGTSLEQEMIIGHAIEPNFAIQGNEETKIKGNFAYREVYWVYASGSKQPLSIAGFVECPFTVDRCYTQSNDAYGRSFGMDVLPDIIQLQMETRKKAEALAKNVSPPLIADISMKNQPTSQNPDSVTFVPMISGGVGMRSLYTQQFNLQDITRDIEAIQNRIKTGFFADLFLMMQDNTSRMTATEINAKMSEKMVVMGPVIESKLNNLKLKLKRVYAIMERKGMISPKPPGLKGIPLTVEFISTMALAQKAAATSGMERIAALIGNMAGVYPNAPDNLDSDAFISIMNELLGNPLRILRGPEKLAQIRQQKAQAAQEEKQQQAQESAAGVRQMDAKTGKTLSETTVGQGQSALQAIVGQS